MPARLIPAPGDHERLAHQQAVGEHARDDERDGVRDPVPVREVVRPGLLVAEDGREVEDLDATSM